MIHDDIANHTGLMIRPDVFTEVFFHRMERLMAPAREHGKPLLMHTRGKMDQVLPVLHDLGANAVHPIEPECNDIFQIKQQWAGKLALVGNIPTSLLIRGSKQEIQDRVREYCVRLAPGGGYVLGSSGGITQDIPPENLVAMTRAVHEYGRYGSLGTKARDPV